MSKHNYVKRSNNSDSKSVNPQDKLDYSASESEKEKFLYYPNMKELRSTIKQPEILLSDKQVADFIQHGFLVLDSGLPNDFHAYIYNRVEELQLSRYNNEGNNILPVIPTLQSIFDSPTIRGALKSILGPNYIMHQHRHPHLSGPGFNGQQWHEDSYWGYNKTRSHVPKWVMAMYYPQDVTLSMGPTAISGNTQFLQMPKTRDRHLGTIPKGWSSSDLNMECKAGSVVLIHYDIWHKATPNKSKKNRYMFKFQFLRTLDPKQPSWSTNYNPDDLKTPFDGSRDPMAPVWQHVWNWMYGGSQRIDKVYRNLSQTNIDPSVVMVYQSKLADDSVDSEPKRLGAAYSLARLGDPGLEALMQALTFQEPDKQWYDGSNRSAMYGLTAVGSAAVPKLIKVIQSSTERAKTCALFALSEIGPTVGPDAVKAIIQQLTNQSGWIRKTASEAIGWVAQNPDLGKELLASCCSELHNAIVNFQDDDQTRFQCVMSLAQLALACNAHVKDNKHLWAAIELALDDPNRYTIGYALKALEFLNTDESRSLLLHELNVARWCPLTTRKTQF